MTPPASPRPRLVPLPNGPLYLLNSAEPRQVEHLVDSKGQPCSTVPGIALCRCGGSANKPFCDGTHSKIGFRDANESDTQLNRRENYVGKSITIHDDRQICSHAGFCTDGLPSVFKEDDEPWINPNGADAAAVIETVRRCPSGALSYSAAGVEHRDQDRNPQVMVSKDGPYVVTGGVELVGVAREEHASTEHYTLCRCGGSKNKPFCDGTHWEIGFKDEKN